MHSHLIGKFEIDHNKVAIELDPRRGLPFIEPYEEFNCGRSTRGEGQLMLCSPGGEIGDGIITNYDPGASSGFTAYGEQLPYVSTIIEQVLCVEHIRFARIVCMTSNVLIPHRDYLEFDSSNSRQRPMHRLHIPLITNEDCMFSDNNTVYRMKPGEVWFLDATQVHTAAALTTLSRMHLIVDFNDVQDRSELLNIDALEEEGIPLSSIVVRPPLSNAERLALHSLAALITEANILDIFGIIAKTHFRRDGGEDFFWNTVGEIEDQLDDRDLAKRLDELRVYYVMDRDR
ncbi:aspartyl/asparaginyl beta-hydroxylase domain-containing protein [Nocardia arthritidis]|uniref:aspartyl/asparaginyl beta-hydroxylase domain-containing protein n=1 Tax=Nocardia arthritidis TaxID=228602 RepID=UPI00142DBA57|nr:aspartyl/asparaginyl beta-hydroxylase domain-containing protein [Nocardia arthritidis]